MDERKNVVIVKYLTSHCAWISIDETGCVCLVGIAISVNLKRLNEFPFKQ